MNTEIDLQTILEVQDYFQLPSPALVEKDFYVTKALAALSKVHFPGFTLIFGGGASLCRAHRLIKRMSEDIDLKIMSDMDPTRSQLRELREHVTEALLHAGFLFDPNNRLHRDSRNESRYTIFRLPYAPFLSGEGILRPEIQIELTAWPLHCPSIDLSLSSFVAEALQNPLEVERLACVSITLTAAEKFVALTRRTAAELAEASGSRDLTLVRHIYDLHVISSYYQKSEVAALARAVMQHDAVAFGNQFPAYRDHPVDETSKALTALQTDPEYQRRYHQFQRAMVYGEQVDFYVGLGTLQELFALL